VSMGQLLWSCLDCDAGHAGRRLDELTSHELSDPPIGETLCREK